ncbi:MAG: hypothetical protein ABSF81_08050 [Bacteroidales bacterium]|jgi:hypothetical protein
MKKLNDIPAENPFKVPDDYFEEVNRKIISITTGRDYDVKKIRLYDRIRPYLLIAASVAGFILISYAGMKLLTPDKTKNSQISEVLKDENPDSYMNDIDIYSLEENASSLNLSEEGPEVSKTDIIEYLLLDNVEISDIYEQL